jgi:hypothetical protein
MQVPRCILVTQVIESMNYSSLIIATLPISQREADFSCSEATKLCSQDAVRYQTRCLSLDFGIMRAQRQNVSNLQSEGLRCNKTDGYNRGLLEDYAVPVGKVDKHYGSSRFVGLLSPA